MWFCCCDSRNVQPFNDVSSALSLVIDQQPHSLSKNFLTQLLSRKILEPLYILDTIISHAVYVDIVAID